MPVKVAGLQKQSAEKHVSLSQIMYLVIFCEQKQKNTMFFPESVLKQRPVICFQDSFL